MNLVVLEIVQAWLQFVTYGLQLLTLGAKILHQSIGKIRRPLQHPQAEAI